MSDRVDQDRKPAISQLGLMAMAAIALGWGLYTGVGMLLANGEALQPLKEFVGIILAAILAGPIAGILSIVAIVRNKDYLWGIVAFCLSCLPSYFLFILVFLEVLFRAGVRFPGP